MIFISDAHEKFYYEKLKEVRYQDVYHKALVYCLGISDDTRRNIKSIYDFKTGNVKTKCLHEGWQTSGSVKVVRMAFNLYCNGTPSVLDYDDAEEQVDECRMYTVEELFCCAYAPYFWQAVQIRYPVCTVDVSSERPLPCSPLPSTGITRLPWYYETIRLPATHPLISIF
ncbi:DUF6075 family protein [uncultured Phocaeicola sp.]|uniref:DUF6075 family protein n=1 Tax=uncultured Phocaeicola sp. TaxID=990718 RepID=UPI003391C458